MAAVAAPDATAGTTTEVAPTRRSRPRKFWSGGVRRWWRAIQPFGAGVAVTAALAIALSPPHAEKDPAESVVASHIRALQPGHLMDVASTDQHTVKPWFDGRLDYAPPVKDLATDGFPLIGGRLDYLDGRPVAALAYRHAQHIIDFYVWPRSGRSAADGGSGGVNGYNYVRWSTNDMTFWAVSDVNPADLDTFIADWRAAP
jgi:anti-sigma factor RsiW